MFEFSIILDTHSEEFTIINNYSDFHCAEDISQPKNMTMPGLFWIVFMDNLKQYLYG